MKLPQLQNFQAHRQYHNGVKYFLMENLRFYISIFYQHVQVKFGKHNWRSKIWLGSLHVKISYCLEFWQFEPFFRIASIQSYPFSSLIFSNFCKFFFMKYIISVSWNSCFFFLVFNRGDTVSRRSPIEGVRPSPYTTLCS